jgi:hypothetical protein
MYTYATILKDALSVNWQVEDLIGAGHELDFRKPFLPEVLVGIEELNCLSVLEKLRLNQIRGRTYLHLFVLVEEFIIPMVLDQVKAKGYADLQATHALLCFAEEEGKHIRLFQEFAAKFEVGFPTACECIGPAETMAADVLQHSPLGVLLMILHIEWMTQSHYLESVRDDDSDNLEPHFCNLLKHHWLEEAQHTKLDTLLVQELTPTLSLEECNAAVADYLAIVQYLDAGLQRQVTLDLHSLERAIGRRLTTDERQEIGDAQFQSYRWTFLCTGMTHPHFVKIVETLSPIAKEQVAALAHQVGAQGMRP